MSTAAPEAPANYDAGLDENTEDYRALHTGALLGLLFAIVSLIFPIAVTSFADATNAALLGLTPALGLVISLWALSKIKASPELYTGSTPAMAGAAIAAVSLLVGAAYGSYVYATEVPEGYTRTTFIDLKPDKYEEAGREAIPEDIQALMGQKVFIKGYIRPDSTNGGLRRGISEFLLVRDNQQCCFGNLSDVKYYDQVAVELDSGLTADYSQRVFRLGGALGARRGVIARGEPPIVYTLEGDYLE